MSEQSTSKQLVEAYVNAFNRGDLDALRALFSSDAEIQGVLGKGQMDKIMPIWRQLVDGLAMQPTIEDIVAEGDTVAVRYTRARDLPGAVLRSPTHRQVLRAGCDGLVRDRKWADPLALGRPRSGIPKRQIGMPLE